MGKLAHTNKNRCYRVTYTITVRAENEASARDKAAAIWEQEVDEVNTTCEVIPESDYVPTWEEILSEELG